LTAASHQKPENRRPPSLQQPLSLSLLLFFPSIFTAIRPQAIKQDFNKIRRCIRRASQSTNTAPVSPSTRHHQPQPSTPSYTVSATETRQPIKGAVTDGTREESRRYQRFEEVFPGETQERRRRLKRTKKSSNWILWY